MTTAVVMGAVLVAATILGLWLGRNRGQHR